MIWNQNYTLDQLNSKNAECMVGHCDIEMTQIDDDALHARMKVSHKIKQPFGIVHGGANCVLAETLGSVASNMVCNSEEFHAVGLSITTNHVRAVRNGFITGVAKAKHLGKTTHVWIIETFNDANQLTSTTTFTTAVVKKLNKA